jgi:hypothetical protein
MVDGEGELVAEGKGVFRPGEDQLPPAVDSNEPADSDVAETDAGPTPPPATFMPVHTTPYGIVCLN